MRTIRITIVDATGSVSFLAPPHAMKMLAAACGRDPDGHIQLLALAEEYDPELFGAILANLRAEIDGASTAARDGDARDGRLGDAPLPFLVTDDASRQRSLEPAALGLIVFNLPAKRIVQVQNSYGELRPSDRGRLRRNGHPVRAYYRYALPPEWTIVP